MLIIKTPKEFKYYSIMNKKIIILLIVVISIIFIGAQILLNQSDDNEINNNSLNTDNSSINSYDECVAAGYPIMESFPEQCAVPGGNTFVNESAVIKESIVEEKSKAIQQAKEYKPEGVCTMALVDAVHIETGAEYTFPSGCLAPGWEPKQL